MTIALLCIDLVNEAVDPKGKMADRGYVEFENNNDVLQRIRRIQDHFREQGGLVIHTRTGFSKNYPELAPVSPILAPMKEMNALKLGEWGTEFPEVIAPQEGEPVINKHRMGPFYRTRLEIILRSQEVKELYIVGLSTMGSVALSAMEAHDRDLNVCVIKDGCLDMTDERHELGLQFIQQCGEVKDFKDIALRLTDFDK